LTLDIQLIPERVLEPDELIPVFGPIGRRWKLPLQMGRLLGEKTQVHQDWHGASVRPASNLRNG
jgi:hypothetical protein